MADEHDINRDADSGSGATIIRHSRGRLDIEVFPNIFVEHTGMLRLDATTLCSDGPGILLHGADRERAQAVADALQAHGEDCTLVPADEVLSAPDPTLIHSGRLTTSGFRPVDAASNEEFAKWEHLIVLALAHVETTRTITESASGNILTQHMPYGGIGGAAGAALGRALSPGGSKSEEKTAQETCLDIIFRKPLRRYRIIAGHFDYGILGDQLHSSSQANVVTLARWFVHAGPRLRTNFDADELMKTGSVEIPSMSRAQFRDLVDWLLNLVRFGIENVS